MRERPYKVWCGTTDRGFATDSVNVDAENREDAIAQALEYLNTCCALVPENGYDDVPEGTEWACYEIQESSGWYKRENPEAVWVLEESYLD